VLNINLISTLRTVMPRTEPPAAEGAGKLLQDVQSVVDGLSTTCAPTCTCHKLPHVLARFVQHLTNLLQQKHMQHVSLTVWLAQPLSVRDHGWYPYNVRPCKRSSTVLLKRQPITPPAPQASPYPFPPADTRTTLTHWPLPSETNKSPSCMPCSHSVIDPAGAAPAVVTLVPTQHLHQCKHALLHNPPVFAAWTDSAAYAQASAAAGNP
jgi:hypothetical protein